MAKQTIKLKKYLDVIIEQFAAAGITPGHILELTSTDKYCRKHSGGGEAVAPVLVALEDELQGGSIDDAYTQDQPVQVWVGVSGEVFLGILATDQDVNRGDHLESNGDGTLRKYTPADSEATGHQSSIVGVALESVDTTGSLEGRVSRIRVMVR